MVKPTATKRTAAPATHRATAPVTIGWAGDAVPASSSLGLPLAPSVLFAAVRPILEQPELMFGNLEGTLTDRGSSKCGAGSTDCFAFRAPPSYAKVFAAAGYDVVNQANNHAADYGSVGHADTYAALDAAGLAHTGAPGEIAIRTVHGTRVAFLGFSTYPWTSNLNVPSAVKRLVRKARSQADVVVVALHGGAEGADATHVPNGHQFFLGEDRGDLRSFARTAIDAGADVVVGSGPHVVRGLEFYKRHLIAYSTGNFVGYGHVFALQGLLSVSAVLDLTLGPDGSFRTARIIPIRLSSNGIPAPDPSGEAVSVMRRLSQEDFGARAARVAANGTIAPPPAG